MLEHAQGGVFTQFEVQRGLPVQMLVKYFDAGRHAWRVKPEIARDGAVPAAQPAGRFLAARPFDIVFCRNVLIYFDQETKIDVLKRIAG